MIAGRAQRGCVGVPLAAARNRFRSITMRFLASRFEYSWRNLRTYLHCTDRFRRSRSCPIDGKINKWSLRPHRWTSGRTRQFVDIDKSIATDRDCIIVERHRDQCVSPTAQVVGCLYHDSCAFGSAHTNSMRSLAEGP